MLTSCNVKCNTGDGLRDLKPVLTRCNVKCNTGDGLEAREEVNIHGTFTFAKIKLTCQMQYWGRARALEARAEGNIPVVSFIT